MNFEPCSFLLLFRFLFSESTKLTSVGGEKALGAMIAGLSESVEKEFGVFSARLYGIMKQVSESKFVCHIDSLFTMGCTWLNIQNYFQRIRKGKWSMGKKVSGELKPILFSPTDWLELDLNRWWIWNCT